MMKKQGIDVPAPATFNMSEDSIKRIKQEAFEEAKDDAVTTAITLLLSIPVKVVVEKYDWCAEDVEAFCEDLLDEYEKFDGSDMSLADLQKYVYEHCGVKFERK